MTLARFHPAVRTWFAASFEAPTEAQAQAWPAIATGQHVLIAAPTGSGKTLAAFMWAIHELSEQAVASDLGDATQVLYVSPLKALSNDIHQNLEIPLAGIEAIFRDTAPGAVPIRAQVRTGDTPQSERARMRKKPPHILVTTPESLYLLLTSKSGRAMLSTVRTVIVDELHSLAASKRGAHLLLSLERLCGITANEPKRIGISATQKPIQAMAEFLLGARASPCTIVDAGHWRERDLEMVLPASPLSGVMANEVWAELYQQLAELVSAHRTTLIFVNTRRLAERLARHLAQHLGEEFVTAHHGSLAREHRLDAEQRLKSGQLRALVATASLELGIDIGDIDLVCQLGSPRWISTFLQRVGRAGHALDATPKGRLFPLTRDDLAECTALLHSVRNGELDRVLIPHAPLDVLSQQIVAECACRDVAEQELFDAFRHASSYRGLPRADFDAVVKMLADGFSTRRGRRGAYLHRDAVNGILRARRGARITALTNAGAIPDQFDFDVLLSPEGLRIGNLNEDFAFESLPGDIFQLGNQSYRILKIETGIVHVEDAHGQPPTIPFWVGDALGRSDELSRAVATLNDRVSQQCAAGITGDALSIWLVEQYSLPTPAAAQLAQFLGDACQALGALPTQSRIILERFFDETGDMHLVIHAPFGSRCNRAWGLALRKRFCRKFNFELQASALEDSIILSLGPTHSFEMQEVPQYLHSKRVRDILVQALLDAPMFPTQWRWNASVALAVKRNINGRRTPPQFQRNDAEDLAALVFPDQLACLENIAGEREIPDHPLVAQTLDDCLRIRMDIDALEAFLQRLEAGQIEVVCRDLPTPSPLAQAIINARPFAFLDDGEAENRRTLAVRSVEPLPGQTLSQLYPEAVQRVCEEAWPNPRDAEEMHDALVLSGFFSVTECAAIPGSDVWLSELAQQSRVTRMHDDSSLNLWCSAERLGQMKQILPGARCEPGIAPAPGYASHDESREICLTEIMRSRLEALGPVCAVDLAAPLQISIADIEAALLRLENDGFAVRGQFPDLENRGEIRFTDRRLLARMHRYSLNRRRAAQRPVSPAALQRFLLQWHGLSRDRRRGEDALVAVLQQLEGFPVAASAWEAAVLAPRLRLYLPDWLDRLCSSGQVAWARLATSDNSAATTVHATPIVICQRAHLPVWQRLSRPAPELPDSARARAVLEFLRQRGASFAAEIGTELGLLDEQVQQALSELVAQGHAASDGFAGLRALILPARLRHRRPSRLLGRTPAMAAAGRWFLLDLAPKDNRSTDWPAVEHCARCLLRRYGVIFRALVQREPLTPPWRQLLYVLRRMEARGEVQGGRFVHTFAGEQFALSEAIKPLRRAQEQPESEPWQVLSACDPLNLAGIITPGNRITAAPGNGLLLNRGVPAASRVGGEVERLQDQTQESLPGLDALRRGVVGTSHIQIADHFG